MSQANNQVRPNFQLNFVKDMSLSACSLDYRLTITQNQHHSACKMRIALPP